MRSTFPLNIEIIPFPEITGEKLDSKNQNDLLLLGKENYFISVTVSSEREKVHQD